MDYNADKYMIANSDLLTETEKLQMARDLRALELKGLIEWRDGAWQLSATSARFGDKFSRLTRRRTSGGNR